ncbi:MAG TPA: cytochrome c-type biogenesis CcmF C-terminal domain-containing protein, partial [Burkholderiaceae bacterium]|nr:cytochrome c-type biogenesis CcmF C-terminal domain-containing protein [Burkholderiaceae bacterium]
VQARQQVRHGHGSWWHRLASQGAGWWGMQLAHVGVAVFVVGVTAVNSYEIEKDVQLSVGEEVGIGKWRLRFEGVSEREGPNYVAKRGAFALMRADAPAGADAQPKRLHSEKRTYVVQGMPMTEAAIDSGLWGDVYVSLGEPVGPEAWTVRVYAKPMVTWIWGGCVLMALGGFFAVADRRYRSLAARERAGAA